jgi:hypothetical protein
MQDRRSVAGTQRAHEVPCETVSGGAGGFVAGGLVSGGLVAGGVVAGGKVVGGTVVGGFVAGGVVAGGKVAAGTVAVGAFAGGFSVAGAVAEGAVAEGAVAEGAVAVGLVAPGALAGTDVPVDRGAGVAAEGWAKVVSVAARSMLVAAGSMVVGALLSGEVDGVAVVAVDALTDEVGASATGAGAITVSAGAAATEVAAGASSGASIWAACLADAAAASAWAMRAAPPRVAEMLAPATVIFEAKPMMGRRRRISATCLQGQDEQREGGGEQDRQCSGLPEGTPQVRPRCRFRHCINSVHASVSAGR